MPILSIESSVTVGLTGGSGISYLSARNAGVASTMDLDALTMACGQFLQGGSPAWNVVRAGMIFDLSDLPVAADITAAKLKIYGDSDSSATDFTLVVGNAVLSAPPTYSDYKRSNWEHALGTLGSLSSAAFSVGSFNDITLNANGLIYINAAIQDGEVEIGLTSQNDFLSVAPTQLEFVTVKGQADSDRPILELTYSDWPNDVYPDTPDFPSTGKIDLATYGVISNYLTLIDVDLSLIADADGNVALAEDAWILWDTTSEKIAYDAAEANVTFTTLQVGTLTLNGDLITADLTMDNNSSADNCTVGNDAIFSDTAYATLKSKITDNEVVFTGRTPPGPADDEGMVFMFNTAGDLILKTRDDGQAGVKSDTLVDFSAI